MKKYILPLLLTFAAVSCKEDTLDVYSGSNYLHFTPGTDDAAVTAYNFALDGATSREEHVEIPVEVRLWGYLPTEDVRCSFRIDPETTTALPSDYTDPGYSFFRAGYYVDTLWVKVNRRERLLETDYVVSVDLEAADNGFVVAPAKYLNVRIHVTDRIQNEPVWWGTNQYMGPYSPMKYRLFNIYLGKVLLSLDEYTDMTFRAEAVAFREWLKGKWEDGTYRYYDEDGVTPIFETIPE